MTEEKIKSPIGFPIMIDEQISDSLAFMMACTIEIVQKDPRMILDPRIKDRVDGITRIMDLIDDKVHERGWCKDPNCEWKKKD